METGSARKHNRDDALQAPHQAHCRAGGVWARRLFSGPSVMEEGAEVDVVLHLHRVEVKNVRQAPLVDNCYTMRVSQVFY